MKFFKRCPYSTPPIGDILNQDVNPSNQVNIGLFVGEFDVLLPIGGDGTLHEVINGLAKAEEMKICIAPIPTGTGCDYVRNFKLFDRSNHIHLLHYIKESLNKQKIDIGKIECRDHNGEMITSYFLNICSIGISTKVLNSVRASKLRNQYVYWVYTAYHAMFRLSNRKLGFTIDSEYKFDAMNFLSAICLGKYFGGGMKISPRANTGEARLTLTSIVDVGRVQLVTKVLPALKSGEFSKCSCIKEMKCHTIEIECEGAEMIEADGELVGYLPAKITILPNKFYFI